jgi:ABC-2 type transport system permease protein
MGVLFGMLIRSPDAMQGAGMIVVFPLTFMAGVFVPIAGLAAIRRAFAQWDPVSALVAAVRGLTQNYPSSGSWPLEHPEIVMALWCALILAICVPLAVHRFSRTLAG